MCYRHSGTDSFSTDGDAFPADGDFCECFCITQADGFAHTDSADWAEDNRSHWHLGSIVVEIPKNLLNLRPSA